MIVSKLSRVMGDRRVNMLQMSRDTGIGRSTLHRLYHNQAERVDFQTLDTICEYLDCEITDVLVRVKDEGQ